MMRAMSLSELASQMQGQLVGADATFEGVSTDSRSITPGQLFVALQGDHFDGHDYLTQVHESGAVAALVSRPVDLDLPQLCVADTQIALGQLGAFNRSLFEGDLVAITGSCGKTSVKNMLRAILEPVAATLSTQGNFNNEIGVPLTLLELNAGHRYAVVEMGAAGAGHIAYLCQLGQPRVALLLNAQPAHLEGFGSVDQVASAKGEIFTAVAARADGVAVINADSSYAAQWRELAGSAQVIEFGFGGASVTARDLDERGLQGSQFVLSTPEGEIPVRLSLPGRHNVGNALAAAAGALVLGIPLRDIARGLASVQAEPGRLDAHRAASGARIIDDSYNANPGSVKAAVDLLAQTPGERILVLGAMGELGPEADALHAEVGAYARNAGIEQCWLLGEGTRPTAVAFGPQAKLMAGHMELASALAAVLTPDSVVLVKGSRSAGMEAVVAALLQRNDTIGECG